MTAFTSRALRLAMLDGMHQEDKRTHERLSERLRADNAAVFKIQRHMASLAKELLVIQRRMAAIADAIALEEEQRRAA
jgi:translation initiation factor 2B subunit (eIF-2B alpha/beta/delta family)